MARQGKVIWTETAKKEFKDTCEYWNRRNGSRAYSRRLRSLIVSAAEQIIRYPKSGIPSAFEGVRFVVIRDYLLFYLEVGTDIILVSFWDGRQDPEKLKKRLS